MIFAFLFTLHSKHNIAVLYMYLNRVEILTLSNTLTIINKVDIMRPLKNQVLLSKCIIIRLMELCSCV